MLIFLALMVKSCGQTDQKTYVLTHWGYFLHHSFVTVKLSVKKTDQHPHAYAQQEEN